MPLKCCNRATLRVLLPLKCNVKRENGIVGVTITALLFGISVERQNAGIENII
jgi:hypothetical protein